MGGLPVSRAVSGMQLRVPNLAGLVDRSTARSEAWLPVSRVSQDGSLGTASYTGGQVFSVLDADIHIMTTDRQHVSLAVARARRWPGLRDLSSAAAVAAAPAGPVLLPVVLSLLCCRLCR